MIVAWAAVLPTLPMSTRSAVQEAQPIAIEDDVVVFGVARVRSTGRRPASGATPRRSGRRSPRTSASDRASAWSPDDSLSDSLTTRGPRAGGRHAAPRSLHQHPPAAEEPEEIVDLDELVDAPEAEAAVDSVLRLQNDFGATVVDEIPRT